MEHGSRTRLFTAGILVAVFVAGLLVGVAADNNLVATPPDVVVEGEREKDVDGEKRRREPMYAKVGPSADQMVLIDSVMKDHRARMDALHDEFRSAYNPRYQALIHETREGIKGVFGPEQAAEYQKLLDDYDRRKAERNEKEDRD